MSKNHFTVVRNAAYRSGDFKTRQRHNERENEEYQNGDVDLDRAHLNVHYLQHFHSDGTHKSYQEIFDTMLANDVIVKRGLKADAKVFDELVFDVNTAYFENNGGYEFAKKFYEEAYDLAVKEIGGEEYIISAVMHADEKNVALSSELGYDVYHYHLHVVYVPVVEKEVLWTKRCKDPALVGTVKEVVQQISHSKKWPRVKSEGEYINSYSPLQDRYFEHMKSVGYEGFERGKVGSKKKHLTDLQYKIQQDEKRLADIEFEIFKKEERAKKLDEKIIIKTKAKATIAEVDGMGKSALLGGTNFTDDETQKLKKLAKKAVTMESRNAEWKKRISNIEQELDAVKKELSSVKGEKEYWRKKFKDLEKRTKPFITAIINFPQELSEFISQHWQERNKQKSHSKEDIR